MCLRLNDCRTGQEKNFHLQFSSDITSGQTFTLCLFLSTLLLICNKRCQNCLSKRSIESSKDLNPIMFTKKIWSIFTFIFIFHWRLFQFKFFYWLLQLSIGDTKECDSFAWSCEENIWMPPHSARETGAKHLL